MALQQSVGIALEVSAGVPSAETLTAYKAVTFTAVGQLSEVPNLTGEFDIATFDDLTTGEEVKFSDINRAGEGELKLGFNISDSGQAILHTASLTGAPIVFYFKLKDATTKYYRRGIIKSFMPSDLTTGNVVMASVMVAFFGKSFQG